jgi:hypothetical protein
VLGRTEFQINFQISQPIVAHIAPLIVSASTQGHGEEYRSAGP